MTTETKSLEETTAMFASYGATNPEKLAEEFLAVDWDALADQDRMRDVGRELYELSALFESYGFEHVIGNVAALMDAFRNSSPNRMREGDGKYIADGFAHSMLLAAAATVPHDGDEEESRR